MIYKTTEQFWYKRRPIKKIIANIVLHQFFLLKYRLICTSCKSCEYNCPDLWQLYSQLDTRVFVRTRKNFRPGDETIHIERTLAGIF